MEAAYGLYTHIRSNRRRSVILLIWLFAFVYLLVYAGALAGEALSTRRVAGVAAAARHGSISWRRCRGRQAGRSCGS